MCCPVTVVQGLTERMQTRLTPHPNNGGRRAHVTWTCANGAVTESKGIFWTVTGYHGPTAGAFQVLSEMRLRNWTAGPSEGDPCVTLGGTSSLCRCVISVEVAQPDPSQCLTGIEQRLHMWQLTPVHQGITWSQGQCHPSQQKQVEWQCELEREDSTTEEWHPAVLHGFSATVLRFTLDWPPFKLQDADGEIPPTHLQQALPLPVSLQAPQAQPSRPSPPEMERHAFQPQARRPNERVPVFGQGSQGVQLPPLPAEGKNPKRDQFLSRRFW